MCNNLMEFEVYYLDEASAERDAIPDATERNAVLTVVEKLQALGFRLPFPHCSSVQGEDGRGLWELRPRSGNSPYRVLYKRIGPKTFVLAAVVPEAEVDPPGFRRGVRQAQYRLEEVEG